MTVTTLARAWAFLRRDGAQLGFTDHDTELVFDDIRFKPESGVNARMLIQACGLSVDNSEAEGGLSSEAISEDDLRLGRWDGAGLRLWEVDWRDTVRRRLLFRGTIGEVTRMSGVFRAELRGMSEALNSVGGRVYHRCCAARFGDSECGVDAAAASVEVRLQDCEEGLLFRFADFPAYDAGWFARGELWLLDGAATGLRAQIRSDDALPGAGRRIGLWHGIGAIPQPGDRVRLIAGCDKRARTCRLKFNNLLNFRGFPHLTDEDWLIAPQAGGRRG